MEIKFVIKMKIDKEIDVKFLIKMSSRGSFAATVEMQIKRRIDMDIKFVINKFKAIIKTIIEKYVVDTMFKATVEKELVKLSSRSGMTRKAKGSSSCSRRRIKSTSRCPGLFRVRQVRE